MTEFKNIQEKLQDDITLCAVLKDGRFFKSYERGIKPIMEQLKDDAHFFENAILADKVVGKAAAFLAVYSKVSGVYAKTVSAPALSVLKEYNIPCEFDCLVERIENRTKTGLCPMESLCMNITTPEDAYLTLKNKIYG